MAHRGHIWPLHFRRDFNLNVNTYQQGIADAYDVQMLSNDIAAPPPLVGRTIECHRAAMPDVLTLRWLSANILDAGRTWQLRIDLQFVGTPLSATQLTFTLLVVPTTIASIWQINGPQTSDPFHHDSIAQHTVYWNPAVFSRDPAYWVSIANEHHYPGH